MLTTPVIRAIRRARPAAHLSYLVEPQAAPVVLGNPQQTVVIGGASATEARFVVTPTGDLVVKGTVLMPHIMPLGDLSMGCYTNAP